MMVKILLILMLAATVLTLEGVQELTDQNFHSLVEAEPAFWIVMFSASWCGHCTHLKPEIQKLVPLVQAFGASVGHVDQKNQQLVNKYVVDHTTHMVSYPKLKVFLGEELLGDVPSGLRTAEQISGWFRKNFNLEDLQSPEL